MKDKKGRVCVNFSYKKRLKSIIAKFREAVSRRNRLDGDWMGTGWAGRITDTRIRFLERRRFKDKHGMYGRTVNVI